ncbi:hypothetical protein ACS0PU_007563 [Formica fusca]
MDEKASIEPLGKKNKVKKYFKEVEEEEGFEYLHRFKCSICRMPVELFDQFLLHLRWVHPELFKNKYKYKFSE